MKVYRSLCVRCNYCVWVTFDGSMNCEVYGNGKEKIYCTSFKSKEGKL